MNPKYKGLFLPLCFAFLFAVAVLTFIAVKVYDNFFGMQLVNERDTAPELMQNEYNILYGGEYWKKAIKENDQIYLDVDVINAEWAEEMLFYADDIDKVLYTTQMERSEFDVGTGDFITREGHVYIRSKAAESLFGTRSSVNEEERVVMVRQPFGNVGEILKGKTYLRINPDLEERHYTVLLRRGDEVEIYPCDTKGFYFAVSSTGYRGYIEADRVNVEETTMSRKEPSQFLVDPGLLFAKPVSIIFHQVYVPGLTEEMEDDIWNGAYYMHVIAPTWFSLNAKGGIDSLASTEYQEFVQEDFGIEIYAVFTNSFDDELTYEVLHSTPKRDALCQKILQYCKDYNLQGINVDFEGISERTAPYYIQFIRELSIVLRLNSYVLSVDVPVPSEWSTFYRRDILNDICDYVVVMAYDEHYAGDPVPGSTSSQSFTVNAIANTLAEGVSKDKLILAMPWYTRVWMTDQDGDLSSIAVGMGAEWDYIYDYEFEEIYDDATCQDYVEGDWEGVHYQIWLENETSQSWRLRMVKDSELGGVAGWSLGLQNYEAWNAYTRVLFNK